MKQKLSLTLVIAACLVALFSVGNSNKAAAAVFSTKAECAGNVLTVTSNAPSSVTTNTSFSITGVSSTSTAPNGITITKIVSTSSVSNGSPSTMVGTWTGSGTGTFTAHLPDASVKATGAAGSQVRVILSSIDLYINGGSSPITCSQGNGQLTANKTGESLTVLSVGITAPVAAPTPTPTPTGATTTPTPTKTNSPTTASNTSPTPSNSQPTSQNQTANNSPSATNTAATSSSPSSSAQGQTVTITVVDSSGKPASNVAVVIDDGPEVATNDRGVVIVSSLSAGDHKVAVLGKQTKITRTIKVASSGDPIQLTIQLKHQLISPLIIIVAGIPLFLIIALAIVLFVRHRRKQQLASHFVAPQFAEGTSPIVSSMAVPQPNPGPTPASATIPQSVQIPTIQPISAPIEPTPTTPAPVNPSAHSESLPGQVFAPQASPQAPTNISVQPHA